MSKSVEPLSAYQLVREQQHLRQTHDRLAWVEKGSAA